ncbi:MAG: hypothetical protein R3E95_00295 [Thiolinea sp.]
MLFAVDGYFYNGKRVDIRAKVQAVQAAIGSIEQTVIIPLLGAEGDRPGIDWHTLVQETQKRRLLNFYL